MLRTCPPLCWLFVKTLEKTKIYRQPPILTCVYFASSFLTQLQSFFLTLPFVLCLLIEFEILQTLGFPSTCLSFTQLKKKLSLNKLTDVSKIRLINFRQDPVFSFQVQRSFYLHTTPPTQRERAGKDMYWPISFHILERDANKYNQYLGKSPPFYPPLTTSHCIIAHKLATGYPTPLPLQDRVKVSIFLDFS